MCIAPICHHADVRLSVTLLCQNGEAYRNEILTGRKTSDERDRSGPVQY